MTQTYNSCGFVRPFGFGRLLFRWSASIWQAIYVELAIWLAMFYTVSIIYWSLPAENKRDFEKVVLDWGEYNSTSVTVVTFALGFYVTQSFTRWWDQWNNIPWIDPFAQCVNATIRPKTPGQDDEKGIKIRRTLVRWVNLSSALTFQTVSEHVGTKYRGLESLIKIGLVTSEEAQEIMSTDHDTHVYFIPLTWAANLLAEAHEDGRINDMNLVELLQRLEQFRRWCGNLLAYKWVPIPLIYTHVITVAVYFHFLIELIGGQFLDPKQHYDGHLMNWGVPIFDTVMFVALIGWLKAAELMKHPFGLDEDAFELLWILRRNVDVGLDIVTSRYGRHPKLVKDKFWDVKRPLGKSPKRPGVTTLSFGKEHKHVDEHTLRERRTSSYSDAPHMLNEVNVDTSYEPPESKMDAPLL